MIESEKLKFKEFKNLIAEKNSDGIYLWLLIIKHYLKIKLILLQKKVLSTKFLNQSKINHYISFIKWNISFSV